jgi:MFS family permease
MVKQELQCRLEATLVFLGGSYFALAGMALWAIGQVTQDMLLKAVVAGVLPKGKRNLAFGLFFAGYGSGWLVGSIATGLLYEHSRIGLIAFAVTVQLVSLPLFVLARRREPDSERTVRRSATGARRPDRG